MSQATDRPSFAVPTIFTAGFRFYFLAAGLFARTSSRDRLFPDSALKGE